MLHLINNTLQNIIRYNEFNISQFMNSLISKLHYNGGVFFEVEENDKYKCTYVSGKVFLERFTVGQILSITDLPDIRLDLYLRDSPIAAIVCDPFEADVLEQVTQVVILSLSMIKIHRRNRALMVNNLEQCQDSLDFIAKAFIVNKQFVSILKNDTIVSQTSYHIGKALRYIREMRDYHVPLKPLVFSEAKLDVILVESLEVTKHKNVLIEPHVQEVIYIDVFALQRSVLIPVLQQYGVISEIHIDTHDINIVDGFLVIKIIGNVPDALKNVTSGNILSLLLSYNTCVKNGGYFRVSGPQCFEFSMPYKTTLYSLKNKRVLIEILNNLDNASVMRLCTSLESEFVSDMSQNPDIVICDRYSKLLDIVDQNKTKTILFESERKLIEQLFRHQ